MIVVVVNKEGVLSADVVKELEAEQCFFEFGSYYFASVCSKFNSRLVFFARS